MTNLLFGPVMRRDSDEYRAFGDVELDVTCLEIALRFLGDIKSRRRGFSYRPRRS